MFRVAVVGSANNVGAGRYNGRRVGYVRGAAGACAAPCQSTRPAKCASATACERDISSRRDYAGTVCIRDGRGAAGWVVDEDGSRGACYCCGGWISGLHSCFFVSCQVGAEGV